MSRHLSILITAHSSVCRFVVTVVVVDDSFQILSSATEVALLGDYTLSGMTIAQEALLRRLIKCGMESEP